MAALARAAMQLPAILPYDSSGPSLTVVVSPLVSLIQDQVRGAPRGGQQHQPTAARQEIPCTPPIVGDADAGLAATGETPWTHAHGWPIQQPHSRRRLHWHQSTRHASRAPLSPPPSQIFHLTEANVACAHLSSANDYNEQRRIMDGWVPRSFPGQHPCPPPSAQGALSWVR